jgi:hypothetical protein
MNIERAADACTGGSDTSYLNGKCRCDDCKGLSTEYRKRKYYERHEANKAKMRSDYQRKREENLDYKIARAYGITKAQWYQILEAQDGTCAICKGGADCGGSRPDAKFHVDHCHETGRIRGLLCAHCNQAIGLLRVRPDIALAAAEYLE